MAGGDGSLCRSSAGRWRPLFSKIKVVASPEGANGKAGAECGANDAAAPQSAVVQLGGPAQDGGGGNGTPKAPPAPPKSILVTDGQAATRRSTKRKLTWLHGLVDQEIEPLPLDEEDARIAGCQKRSFARKTTGWSFGETKEEEKPAAESVEKAAERALDSEAAALKQDREKDAILDDADSVGFSSDSEDEFAEVEELATKNMRLNQAATRISDVEREANEMDLPLAPLTPLSPLSPAAKPKSDGSSSFASSSDGGGEAKPVVTHAADAATGLTGNGFVVLPAGSGCAAVKQLRKQDSKSECSSFGDSSDDGK